MNLRISDYVSDLLIAKYFGLSQELVELISEISFLTEKEFIHKYNKSGKFYLKNKQQKIRLSYQLSADLVQVYDLDL